MFKYILSLFCLFNVVVVNSHNITELNDSIDILQHYYYNDTGVYGFDQSWHSANSLEVLVNYITLTNDTHYIYILENSFYKQNIDVMKETMYNDDLLWYASMWYRAYKLTKREKYLNRTHNIFNYVSSYWNNKTCNGGIYWSYKMNYKNSITNELFMNVAFYLHNEKLPVNITFNIIYNWFMNVNLFDINGLVNDGLNNNCNNNNKTTWTYNQGVILPVLGHKNISLANNLIYKTISLLTDDKGIFREYCEFNSPKCNPPCVKCDEDQEQFKGIFMRYLMYFMIDYSDKLDKNDIVIYSNFIKRNINSVVLLNNVNNNYGLCWNGKCKFFTDYIVQTSVIDLLLANFII